MNKNKMLILNMGSNVISLGVSISISLFLSPYIVKVLGREAFGYLQLSNNIISYFLLVTMALNSMSNRFISINYYKGNLKESNLYYSSTFFSNLVLTLVLFPIGILGILNISKILNIPINLIVDVKLLMFFIFSNFLLSLLSTNLGLCYFITNKLYISSMLNIGAGILKSLLLLLLYINLKPHIFYMGLSTLILTIVNQLINIHYKTKLIPELKLSRMNIEKSKIKELLKSGIWNSISYTGVILMRGMDLILTNLMISSSEMGLLAIVNIIPNFISMFINKITSVFIPTLTKLYSQKKFYEFHKELEVIVKIIGILTGIPICIFLIFGENIFFFWFPDQDAFYLYKLSILAFLPWIITGNITIFHNIFTIINKVKINSILVLITGVLNIIFVIVLLKISNLGLYIIAGVSSILSIMRNLFWTLQIIPKYTKGDIKIYSKLIGRHLALIISISFFGLKLKEFFYIKNIIYLLGLMIIFSFFILVIMFYIYTNKIERNKIKKMIKKEGENG